MLEDGIFIRSLVAENRLTVSEEFDLSWFLDLVRLRFRVHRELLIQQEPIRGLTDRQLALHY